MTNHLGAFACAALISIAAGAADKPAAAKPAAAATPAAATPAAAAQPHYTQTGGTLEFTFDQGGADNKGSFKKFSTTLGYDEKNPTAGKLNVTVQIASVDTQDKDRNDLLAGADLFDAPKYATASYSGTLTRAGAGLEAVGKLTIRGVSKDVRLPLTIRPTANGIDLSGAVKIKRLDFGVGQGEWKSTESVGDVVTVTYKVALSKS
jgi:polyisoprenoid-binding protein YceI